MRIVHSNISQTTSKPVKRAMKSRYDIWAEQESDRVFRSACIGLEDQLARLEELKPGYTKNLKQKLLP